MEKDILQNTLLDLLTGKRQKTLVIFGSSNAAGRGASDYTADPSDENDWASPQNSWAGLIESKLKSLDADWNVFNRSISGSNTVTSIGRFWSDVAPHFPSHVLLSTAFGNENYNFEQYMKNTQTLVSWCKAIGAIPIVRGGYAKNNMTADQYAKTVALNRRIEQLGVPIIDHLSILDNGSGHFLTTQNDQGQTVNYTSDGTHFNDGGNLAAFKTIDTGILIRGGFITDSLDALSVGCDGITNSFGIRLEASTNLDTDIESFAIYLKMKTHGDTTTSKNLMSFDFIDNQSSNPRLRNPGSVGGAIEFLPDNGDPSIVSSYFPVSDHDEHQIIINFNHLTKMLDFLIYDSNGTPDPNNATYDASNFPTKNLENIVLGSKKDSDGAPLKNWSFSAFACWRRPLSNAEIEVMIKGGSFSKGGLFFDANTDNFMGTYLSNKISNGQEALAESVYKLI